MNYLDPADADVTAARTGDVPALSAVLATNSELATAEYLLGLGAQINALPGWEPKTPLDATADDGHHALLSWLQVRGAVTTSKLAEG